ncbi:NAD(P)-dependent alcohol dehydrogenase [Pseudoalteromonas sp. 68 DY56-GL68]|uniref:NAD(P)-dependent alcohol dehydrogenase n=1 Tax=Pseudoalteromonas sp. 68 DY56-GL68 TaxID=2974919 RepID=UPI00352AD752
MKTVGYAAHDSEKPLEPYHFERRALRDEDVSIEILYCGVCHSDLHTAENDWGWTQYPVIPGHEIVGRVLEVGSGVTKYKVGDNVAVGCMVDSCLSCDQCHHGEEQFCREGMVGTYSGQDRISGELTQGGYSKHIVVREEFVLSVPEGLDLAKCAPILCAGITTYSPLRTWNVGPGSRVGVIGLGGLGHMAIKIAAAMGAHVTAISRSDKKKQQVLSYGAKDLLVSSDEAAMQAHANQFDVIINTIPVKHDFTPYIPLLDIDGTQVLVGQVGELAESNSVPLLMGRRRVAGSLIGGIAQTQEILDFCALHNILPEVEMIKMEEINDAFDKLKQGDMASRFVIDMSSLEV